MAEKSQIAVIGTGNLGAALIRGLLDKGAFRPNEILAFDVDKQKRAALRKELGLLELSSLGGIWERASLIVIAVKPSEVAKLLHELSSQSPGDKLPLIISVAAGVSLKVMRQACLQNVGLVRVMPNLPALVGQGMTAIYAPEVAHAEQARILFSALGETVVLAEEETLDAVTGLSGSGPAFVFSMIEALAEGGVNVGLAPELALSLAVQTAYGALSMLKISGEHPASLREKVSSPKGTTVCGLLALEEGKFRETLISAVQASTRRAAELRTQLESV